jgi:phosphoglucomutase
MADPTVSWWIVFLTWLKNFIKKNWSGLAVMFYDYEEKKIDAAKQEQKTAELKEKLAQDETNIRKTDSLKSDDDIIKDELGSKPSDP